MVLSRHVLWAMPDPAAALDRWVRLLVPDGHLVLVEGRWHTGAGIRTAEAERLVRHTGRSASVTPLTDPVLWCGPVGDERYLLVSSRPAV